MTDEHNFKVGDKVYMAYDPTISAIVTDVCHEGKCDYYVKEDGSEFTTGYHEYELLDVKTAFLSRLQSLLKEFDAEIGDSGIRFLKGMEITFGTDTPRIRYNHCTINADNIMDFDKE